MQPVDNGWMSTDVSRGTLRLLGGLQNVSRETFAPLKTFGCSTWNIGQPKKLMALR
jgi:hypothetical protein